jgi:hypothetical protein
VSFFDPPKLKANRRLSRLADIAKTPAMEF